jgi:hypothetical protein
VLKKRSFDATKGFVLTQNLRQRRLPAHIHAKKQYFFNELCVKTVRAQN